MRAITLVSVAFLLWLESASPGSGFAVISVIGWILGLAARSEYIGLIVGLVLLLPAYLLGADHKAKAMLDEEEDKLRQRQAKWRVF
jgi:hypothetical protein